MLEAIGHRKLLEWAAFCEIEQEEAEKARKQAENPNRLTV